MNTIKLIALFYLLAVVNAGGKERRKGVVKARTHSSHKRSWIDQASEVGYLCFELEGDTLRSVDLDQLPNRCEEEYRKRSNNEILPARVQEQVMRCFMEGGSLEDFSDNIVKACQQIFSSLQDVQDEMYQQQQLQEISEIVEEFGQEKSGNNKPKVDKKSAKKRKSH